MSQHWIKGNLYAPEVSKSMQQNLPALLVGTILICGFLIGFGFAVIQSTTPFMLRLFSLLIGISLFLLLLYQGKGMLAVYRQRNAAYSCGEYAVSLQLGEESRVLPWYKGVVISRLEAADGPTVPRNGFEGAKPYPWSHYFALWAIGDKPPISEQHIATIIINYPVVILPDTPEVRQYLLERLGLKEIPEYPNTAIYSPIQQDPQWGEE